MATNNALNNRSAPFTVVAGDLSVTTNNFNLPDTTSSASGVITVGLQPFIHAYNQVGVANNTFVGAFAGNFTNTGISNTGIGAQALVDLTSGTDNTVVGSFAGRNITTGQFNTIVGSDAGSIDTGGSNTLIGYNSGITGNFSHSTYVGFGSGSGAASDNNVAVGSEVLPTANGGSNTAMGRQTCFNTTGTGNVALGFQAMSDAVDANFNVAVGRVALQNADFGAQRNVALGLSALQALKGGNYNVSCGADSGTAYVAGESSNIVIGYGVTGSAGESNVLRIGADTGTGAGELDTAIIHGIVGNTVSNTRMVTIDSVTSQLGEQAMPSATSYTYTNVATSPYVVLSTDQYISVDSSGGPRTIQLPNAATLGQVFVIKDRAGTAATNNITITTVGGVVTIDGSATYVMNTAYQSVQVIGNSLGYEIF